VSGVALGRLGGAILPVPGKEVGIVGVFTELAPSYVALGFELPVLGFLDLSNSSE
jgi:hypothetical protein